MELFDYPLYKEVLQSKHGDNVCTWPYVQFLDDLRLHYQPRKDGNGFDFFCFELVVGSSFDEDDTRVEFICYGNAAFDGIRHLHFGNESSDNIGYFNYPITDQLVLIFAHLAKLEKLYCNSPAYENNVEEIINKEYLKL